MHFEKMARTKIKLTVRRQELTKSIFLKFKAGLDDRLLDIYVDEKY